MKKFVVCILAICAAVCLLIFATTNVNDDTADASTSVENIASENDYIAIENSFIKELHKKGYKNVAIYSTDELTDDVLENRTNLDGVVVEKMIGMVAKGNNGDGIILNTKDTEHNYISYNNMDFETHEGTIILTYYVYNPETNYLDDVLERYDFVLNREHEAVK